MRLLVEYKFFEPAFYSTDLPDWGTAAAGMPAPRPPGPGPRGHGPPRAGTNVEQIVRALLAEGLLGGFHFNSRKYADDDLIVGSVDPFELFRIMREIAAGVRTSTRRVHDRPVPQRRGQGRRHAPVGHEHPGGVRQGTAGDERRLAAAQREGDVLGAHRVLLEAFDTDVRPLLARLRSELGVEPDPWRRFAPRAMPTAWQKSAARCQSKAPDELSSPCRTKRLRAQCPAGTA